MGTGPTRIAVEWRRLLPSVATISSLFSEAAKKRSSEAARADNAYQQLIETVERGFPIAKNPLSECIQPYWSVRHSLSVENGIILKGCQIVIPKPLRQTVLQDLHASHQGQEGMKQRARQVVYWPGLSNDIDNLVRNCPTQMPPLPIFATKGAPAARPQCQPCPTTCQCGYFQLQRKQLYRLQGSFIRLAVY